MAAALSQVRAALLRRRAQTAVVIVISLLASGVSTLALTLLVRSKQPWDDAFAHLNGPHLVLSLDAGRVTPAQLDATATLPGVIAAGPPLEAASVPFEHRGTTGVIQVIGRPTPGGDVGRLAVRAGRWPQRPGEIALARVSEMMISPNVGETIYAIAGHSPIGLTVVGVVSDLTATSSLGGTPRGWVLPGQVAPLVDGDQVRLGYLMPYRFQHAATPAELAANRRLVEAALPSGAETGASNWLDMREGSNWLVSLVSGVIFAFSVFALLAVTVIVAAVVSGLVVAGYREIGIAKALGFTPVQVALVIVGQMALPALVGALLGVPIGAAASRFFLRQTETGLNLPVPSPVDPVVAAIVPAGLLLLVAMAALVPALRGGRTNSVRAIAMGVPIRAARRSLLTAALIRLRAPRPVSLGAGDAFARPVRSVLTLVALGFGIATLTFAFTFGSTLQTFVDDRASWGAAHDLDVSRYGGLSDGDATALLTAQPETNQLIATRELPMGIAGRAEAERLIAMRGDAPALGYRAVVGRWFAAPGEAVVASLTARDLGIRVGDDIAGTVDGRPVRLRVVGVHTDVTTGGRGIRVGWETLAALLPAAAPDRYMVQLRPEVDPRAFAGRLTARYPASISVTPIQWKQYAQSLIAFLNGIVGGLALVLAVIAAAGIFNASLLNVRERVHDLASLKSLGMTPKQIAAMTAASSLVLAAVAAILGIPIGIWLLRAILGAMGDRYGFIVPSSAGISPLTTSLVVAGAFVVALAGAALPARWAAATPVAQVLRSE